MYQYVQSPEHQSLHMKQPQNGYPSFTQLHIHETNKWNDEEMSSLADAEKCIVKNTIRTMYTSTEAHPTWPSLQK
jgi:hypothetical protein